VPFGEYLPLQGALETIGLQQLSRLRGGFAAGPTPRPLIDIPGVGKALPLICYEVIFPGALIQGQERPRVMINVTNDGWFGNTTGPRQHLHMTQVRAAEEGIPIIRSANNGISALIDGHGRIIGRLDLNVRGTLDASLPPRLDAPLFARIGNSVFWLLVLLGLAALVQKRTTNTA
jgi:apolipoprotein N-acyltransferase